jgi:hypothetical protein
MGSQFSISKIIQFAQISQYLAGNEKSSLTQLKSGSLIGNLDWLLYMEGSLLQNMNNLNPAGTTVRPAAEYVLSLCGKYLTQAQTILNNLSGSLPVITGPSNQSGLAGFTATFLVSVVSATNVVYQWYKNGVLIPGAVNSSLVIANAQVVDSGSTFFVTATNATGQTVSNTATLTVTANLLAFFYQGTTDYSALLLAGTDSVAYNGSFAITSGQPITATFPDVGSSTEYIVLKYPATETTKTSFLNPPPSGPDGGILPSLALNETSFGGWKYIFSRTGTPFGLNGVNGQVKFS